MARILIVEDDPDLVDLLAEACADEGWEAVAALGMEAVAVAEEQEIAVILLDMKMPPPDGTAIFKMLHESPRTRTIPIIFTTGVDHIGDAGRSLGAFDVLEKPFDLVELVDTIRRALGEDDGS